MNWRWIIVIALTLVVGLGCSPGRRRSDAYQELLDAEKRWLEDQLYKLDYDYGVLKEKHHSTLRENEALRDALQNGDDNAGSRRSSDRPPEDIAPPDIDLGDPTPPDFDLGLPPITPPEDLRPEEEPEDAPDAVPAPAPAPALDDVTPDDATAHEDLIDPRITRIHLNPLLTGGADLDDKPGDDGISVVIEPRNDAGRFVPVAGPLSLVVLDPAQQGEAARVARWDFTLEETREMLTRTMFGQGIHLQLPWPAAPPQSPRLHVFVRYTAPDGAKLEADREIFTEPPGHVSQRWTPLALPAGKLSLATHTAILPGAAEPRPAVAPPAPAKRSPPPALSEEAPRPEWRPYR